MYIEAMKPRLYQAVHPIEFELMLEAQKNGLFSWLNGTIAKTKMNFADLSSRMLYSFPVTKETAPRIFNLYSLALKRLGCEESVPLFLCHGIDLAAVSHGSNADGHMIVVNSACIEHLNDEELIALFGQQIGHIISGHVQNYEFLNSLERGLGLLPGVGTVIAKKLWSFYSKWMIAASYTADRAAFIACGSIQTVINLIKKQIGAQDVALDDILSQKIDKPQKLGVYFVWMSRSIPNFAAVERIQELVRWSQSEEFRNEYPYQYYMARVNRGEEPRDDLEDELMLLHKRADAGNLIAAGVLGRAYILREKTLPISPYTGMSLLKKGALTGEPDSLLFLSSCYENGLVGFKKDLAFSDQLKRASISHDPPYANKIPQPAPARILKMLPEVNLAFVRANNNKLKCTVNTSNAGAPINDVNIDVLKNGLFMTTKDKVYCADVRMIDGEVFGLAVSAEGVFGRMPGEELPFYIGWVDFANGELYQFASDDKKYLMLDKRKIYRCPDDLSGTIGQLIIVIMSKIKQ